MCDIWFCRSGICGLHEMSKLVSVSLLKLQRLPGFWSWGSSFRWDLIQVLFFYFFSGGRVFQLFWHYSVSAFLTFSWLSEAVCQHLADNSRVFFFLHFSMFKQTCRQLAGCFSLFSLLFAFLKIFETSNEWIQTTAAKDCAAAYRRLFNSDWWVGYNCQTFVLTLTCYAVCLVISELEDL